MQIYGGIYHIRLRNSSLNQSGYNELKKVHYNQKGKGYNEQKKC
jgi:hypothetical protein